MTTRTVTAVMVALLSANALPAQSAADLADLRAKYARMEFHDGVAKGTELLGRFPGNDQLRALTILHQFRAGWPMEAGTAADSLYARKPASRWAQLAYAHAAHDRGDMGDRGVVAVDRLLA